MQTIEVVAAGGVTIEAGRVLKLTAGQADARALTLLDKKNSHYRTEAPATFKRGERFGIEGDIPKALVSEVITEEEVAARERAARKAAAAVEDEIAARIRQAVAAAEDFAADKLRGALEKAAADQEAAIAAAVAAERKRILALAPEALEAERKKA